MIVKNRLIPRPTLSEAHIVWAYPITKLRVLANARSLAWCFASFGISDACLCFCFRFYRWIFYGIWIIPIYKKSAGAFGGAPADWMVI